jgi:hypothetical protein
MSSTGTMEDSIRQSIHVSRILQRSLRNSETFPWMIERLSQPARAQMKCFLRIKSLSYKFNHIHLADERFFGHYNHFICMTKFAMHNPNVWKLMNKFQINLNALNLDWLTHVHQPMIEQLELDWTLYEWSHPYWSVVLHCKLNPTLMQKYHKHVDLLIYFQRNREDWKPEFQSLLQEPSFALFAGLNWLPDECSRLRKNAAYLHSVLKVFCVQGKHLNGFHFDDWLKDAETFRDDISNVPSLRNTFDAAMTQNDKNNDAFGYEYYVEDYFMCKSHVPKSLFIPRDLLKCVFLFLRATMESHVLFFSDLLIEQFPHVFWSMFWTNFHQFRRLSRSHWMALFMRCKTLGKIATKRLKFVELLDPVKHDFKMTRKSFKVNERNNIQIVCNFSKSMNLKLCLQDFYSLNYYRVPTLPWKFHEIVALCHVKMSEPSFDKDEMLTWLRLWFSSNVTCENVDIVKHFAKEFCDSDDDIFSTFSKWAIDSVKNNDLDFDGLDPNNERDIVHFLSHPFHSRFSAWNRAMTNTEKAPFCTSMFINTLSSDEWSAIVMSMKDCLNENKMPFFEFGGEQICFQKFSNIMECIGEQLFST